MQETWKAARVGLMVVVGTIVAIAVYRYVDERSSDGDGYHVYAMFDDVQGLIPKSRVLIAGIPVGYIDTIRLDGNRARVDIRINSDVVLYEDARIAMRSASLLGEKLLVINPGSVTEPELPDGGQILEAREPTSMDAILETVSEIATNVRDVSVQMQRSFGTDEAGERMQSALLNLSEALEAVNRTIQSNEAVVGNTLRNVEGITDAAGPRLIRILDNVESATRNLEQVIDERRPDIDRAVGEADDTVASIHRASEELERVLADVRQVTDRTARGEGMVGRLTSDETLIDEVEGIAEGLGDIVGGIGRLQTILEIRSEYNMLANTFKTYFSLRLQPRESRYFLIQVVDDPRGQERTRRETVFQNPAGSEDPPVYTRTTITRSDALRFTIMLAKRVSIATFRVGIMESTGGLGLDLHLLDDRFEFNLDAFAIGVQALPRLRARLNFELVSRFWLVAGVDDALNGTRDVFLGLMLRFNDDDLKSILPFAGGHAAVTSEPPVVQKVVGVVKGVAAVPARLTLGFFAGFRYPFRGARFVYLQHPGLVRFWIFPILITSVLLTVVFYQLGTHHQAWTEAIWASPTGDGLWGWVKRAVHAVFDWGLTFVLGAAALLVVAALASIIAAPFNDLLSEEVERRETGVGGPPFTLGALLRDTVRTVRVEVTKLVIYACVMVPMFILQFLIPVVGALLYTAFGLVFTATYFAVDYVDWPATRRGYGVRRRAALVRERFLPMLGFGAGVYLFLMIPLVNLLFMPAAVAGGTLLFLDLEREGASPEEAAPAPAAPEA